MLDPESMDTDPPAFVLAVTPADKDRLPPEVLPKPPVILIAPPAVFAEDSDTTVVAPPLPAVLNPDETLMAPPFPDALEPATTFSVVYSL